MSKLFRFFTTAGVAVVALVSCNKEADTQTSEEVGAINITVLATPEALQGDAQTRTYIDESDDYWIKWGTGEYMKIAVQGDGATSAAYANSADGSADASNGEKTAEFAFSLTPTGQAPYTYMGIYPASAAVEGNNTNPASYKVELPANQNATASSYDPSAYIMVARPEPFNEVKTTWMASYRRATALNKITLTNLDDAITSVEFTAPSGKVFAGRRHFNLTTGESGDFYYGQTNVVTIDFATALSGSTTKDIWFTSWEVDIDQNEAFKVVAKSATKSYTRTITAREEGIHFKEGYLNTLTINMSSAEQETLSGLADGNYLILANHNSDYFALKGEQVANENRITSENYSGSLESFFGDPSLVWSITKTNSSYTVKNGNNYLNYPGSGNAASLVGEDSFTADGCLMSIDKQSDGTYKLSNTKKAFVLAKNTSSSYFAFYAANTTMYSDIVLVPATADNREQVVAPTFNPGAGAVDANTTVTIGSTTPNATIYYTTGDSDYSAGDWTQGTSVTITEAVTIRAIAVKDGMRDSEISTGVYTVAQSGSVNLSDSEISESGSVAKGTNNGLLAYRLGTASKDGTLTFNAGYSSITFTITGFGSSVNAFSLTNGKIGDATTLNPGTGNATGTLNSGFATTYSGTEYTITVTDPTQPVVLTGHRYVLWGFNAIEAQIDTKSPVTIIMSEQGFDDGEEMTSFTVEGVTITPGAGVRYFNNGSSARVYSMNTFAVSCASVAIKKLEFTYSDGEWAQNCFTSGTYSEETSAWTGSENTVVMTNKTTGQVRISKIVVSFE